MHDVVDLIKYAYEEIRNTERNFNPWDEGEGLSSLQGPPVAKKGRVKRKPFGGKTNVRLR